MNSKSTCANSRECWTTFCPIGATLAVGDEKLSQAADAVTGVLRRIEQIRWCLSGIALAHRHGWADPSHNRFRVASTALPILVSNAHHEALVAMRACAAVLAYYGESRLMDEQIEKELKALVAERPAPTSE